MVWDGKERREFPRAQFNCKLHIFKAAGTLELTTQNISAGGLQVILYRNMEKGTRVDMEIFTEPFKSIKCAGHIVWAVKKPNPVNNQVELFVTGIQFDSINDADRQYLGDLASRAITTPKSYVS